jgi:hypothetical protein
VSATAAPPDPSLTRAALEEVAQYGIATQAAAHLLDAGTGEFLAYFEREILADLVARGGATCRFFEGSYGAGKTHLLRLLGERAAARGMALVRTELSRDLGLEDWSLITRYVLEQIELQVGGETVRGLPALLAALGRGGLAGVAALRRANLPHAGFRAAMLLAVGEPALPPPLALYLRGERVGAAQLRRAGVAGVKDPLSRRNAEQVLNTVLSGLYHLGVPGVMLLFDENEQTLTSERRALSRRLQIAANVMRRLIDGCTTGGLVGTVAIFAVLPGFLENTARQYPAMGQRLEMTRADDHAAAWRWPVLLVDAISSLTTPEDFLAAVSAVFCRLVAESGGATDGLAEQLAAAGAAVLLGHAGAGYRRPLMKQLATLALARLAARVPAGVAAEE